MISVKVHPLLENPALVTEVPVESIPAMIIQLATLQNILAARLISAQADSNGHHDGDRLIGIEDAAQKIGVTEDWLYRRTDRLPFVVRLGRSIRFSERGIEKFIRQRTGH